MNQTQTSYRLKIYADNGKLTPINPNMFLIKQLKTLTTCYELNPAYFGKNELSLKDNDAFTVKYKNQREMLLSHFTVSNRLNEPTIRIYKRKYDPKNDERIDVELTPLYKSELSELLVNSVGQDDTRLNPRKHSYKALKEKCWESFFKSSNEKKVTFLSFVLASGTAISNRFLSSLQLYAKAISRPTPNSKLLKAKKELEALEKEELTHYSKMRGIVIAYQEYKNKIDNEKKVIVQRDPSHDIYEKEPNKVEEFEQLFLYENHTINNLPLIERQKLKKGIDELRGLANDLQDFKTRNYLYREKETFYYKQLKQLIEIYLDIEMSQQLEDFGIEGFYEELHPTEYEENRKSKEKR